MIEEKDPYTDKDEAKKRMCVEFDQYVDFNDLMIAQLRNDQEKLAKYVSLLDMIDSYNSNKISEIDSANPDELKNLVNTYTRPKFERT